MDRYYSTNTSSESGPLYQLRKLNAVVSDISTGCHASSDFIDHLTGCHIITAAIEHINMESPSIECESLPDNISNADFETKKAIFRLLQMVTAISDTYFLNDVSHSLNQIEIGISPRHFLMIMFSIMLPISQNKASFGNLLLNQLEMEVV